MTQHAQHVEALARELASRALAPLEEERERLRRRSEIVDDRLAAIRKLDETLRARARKLEREADDPEECASEARERLLGRVEGLREAQRAVELLSGALP